MATIELGDETGERLGGLRSRNESYDQIVTELVNVYQAEELTLFHGGEDY